MFFDIFSMLCDKKGVSRYVAATAIGKNRSAVAKWKTGAIPNGSTLSLLADYFGVTTDFLLGSTPEAYFRCTEYRLHKAEEAYNKETDSDKKQELAFLIDGLREAISDQQFEELAVDSAQKNKPTAQSDGLEKLEDDERSLLHSYRTMTDAQKEMMQTFIRGIKNAD